MKKKKLLLIAYRAFGDWIYTCPVLPYLFKEYDIYLETCTKVYMLVHNDPRFKHISFFQFEGLSDKDRIRAFNERWDKLKDLIKPDKCINLNGTLELECVAERGQKEFYLKLEDRRLHFANKTFYKAVFDRCEIPIPINLDLQQLYYTKKEIQIVEKWASKFNNKFIIIMPIAGSTSQKVIHNFKTWVYTILDEFPESVVYIAGDELCKSLVPVDNPRIKNLCGNDIPIKQTFLMVKYANYVVGPETGILVAAGMWGTPKTMLCTTSSVFQCNQFHKNDYSIQTKIYCSPCHRAIYHVEDCPEMKKCGDNYYPQCVKEFNLYEVIKYIKPLYKQFQERGKIGPHLQSSTLPVQNKGGDKK